jgi:putative addiction module component (TIGR02574 family)
MKNVLDDILTLSVAERMQLVEDIWDSIAATPEAVPVTDAQRKELARRKRAHQRNPAAAKPWKEVRAKFAACGFLTSMHSGQWYGRGPHGRGIEPEA